MQYLLSVIHDSTSLATAAEMAAIDVFNDRLHAEGQWIFAGGLEFPTATTAAVIDNRGETAVLSEGPLHSSKEFVAGFWIVTALDLDAAHALAAEGSQACNRKIEVRPFL
ncbi:YciI family protein [Salinibacterium sp. PAMC 21357]|uniref:YciI family protein n=1 Tax=Salinibacterium sp. PAMC 21357 TaxID=1112215 RepID=UPI0004744F69|nr:YciI family protein [Salinibacterium sp. PAMC 21357]